MQWIQQRELKRKQGKVKEEEEEKKRRKKHGMWTQNRFVWEKQKKKKKHENAFNVIIAIIDEDKAIGGDTLVKQNTKDKNKTWQWDRNPMFSQTKDEKEHPTYTTTPTRKGSKEILMK